MRLFVAFLLSDAVRSTLKAAGDQLSRRLEGVRWTSPDQLHVTVQFLGDVADRDVSGVGEAIRRGVSEASPFEMTIGGCGCFPPRGPVRIVWAGTTDESGAMHRCVSAVARELGEVGFSPERRPWQGHITMGRVREDRSNGAMRDVVGKYPFPPVVQAVESISLMSSVLSPQGARYLQLECIPLG